ncbi:MAG TPA: site-2 protease family protein [Candidatus Portnoybacteria bacterium]|nr:site-2 protease family protein [Candidatus Portnoybacteria bacterium]
MSNLFLYLIIVLSAIVHEYAHAWTANQLGDPTARYAGRLTLNPLKHIDPFGTVILPLFLMWTGGIFIGYAKPVPFNPHNLRNPKRDIPLVAMAGPISNFLLAFIFAGFLRLSWFPQLIALKPIFIMIILINLWLGFFNLIPVPPLDGAKIIMFLGGAKWQEWMIKMEQNPFLGIPIALLLAFVIIGPLVNLVMKILV